MSTAAVAQGLVDLCRQGKFLDAVEKYYSDAIVSVESASPSGGSPEMQGVSSVRKKTESWMAAHQVHSMAVNGPFVGDKQFAVEFTMDVTHKPSGKRMQMDEIGLYTVEGGKIVHEHFFYNPGA